MKSNTIRIIVFIVSSILFYAIWVNGGEEVYGKFVAGGIDKITSKISPITKAEFGISEKTNAPTIYCYYADRRTRIAMEFCLPIILLLAWHLSLFFDKRINAKIALKYLGVNFSIVYFLQIIFPLLLFNISQSKVKSVGFFIGLQVFGFIVFFLILKDSLLIKYNYSEPQKN